MSGKRVIRAVALVLMTSAFVACSRDETKSSPSASEAISPDDLPEALALWMGGPPWGFSYSVVFHDGVLHYHTGTAEATSEDLLVTPSAADWREFWSSMDELGVWDWKESYTDSHVYDGIYWSVQLARGGRRMHAEGQNDYPGGQAPSLENPDPNSRMMVEPQTEPPPGEPGPRFERYLQAVEHLLGGKPFR